MTNPEDPYAPPPGYAAPPQGYAPAGYGTGPEVQGWLPPGQGQTTSTKAVVALVLAVAAYLPVVPFLGAVIALFLARSARAEILASGGRLTGLGICTAAKVVAIVHLVLVALLVLLFVGVLALGVSFS